jgi:protein O-GlcNAc transferase
MPTIDEALTFAVQYHQAGQLAQAETLYRQVLQIQPNHADALHLLGVAASQQGRQNEAIHLISQAIAGDGGQAHYHNNLGEAYRLAHRLPEAIACYERARQLQPAFAPALNNLGLALTALGRLEEAGACCQEALRLQPDNAVANNTLAMLRAAQGRLDEAAAAYRRALSLQPTFAEAHNNLGITLNDQGRLDEAAACYRRALELRPHYAEAHNNLGTALKNQGKLDEAIACFRRALELKPDYARAHSSLLYSLHYCAGITPAALAEAHADYNRRHAAPLRGASVGHEAVRARQGRLRLGFVSADLARHPVGYFLVRVLENLRQEPCETICYSSRTVKDAMTHRLQAAASQWRDVIGLSDEQLAEQIRVDQIGILFDLSGHTARNRLLVFARKPAPIQVTWIGYEGTTGLTAMDYLLADRYQIPEGNERFYREHVLRMPESYRCYDPPERAPPVAPPPSLQKGHVTFGSFNNLAKITPEVVAVWAEILRRAPTARLILKHQGLGDPTVQRRYLDAFVAHGVEAQRLTLLPSGSYGEYLATYHEVDVVLDPFPFAGGATTCEALWMGVPVLTCPFETFASRHSLGHLSSVGLTATIAHDLDDYVARAVTLAGDLPRLAELRAGLRERMAASPLCDGKRFVVNLMRILGGVWQEWCAGSVRKE